MAEEHKNLPSRLRLEIKRFLSSRNAEAGPSRRRMEPTAQEEQGGLIRRYLARRNKKKAVGQGNSQTNLLYEDESETRTDSASSDRLEGPDVKEEKGKGPSMKQPLLPFEPEQEPPPKLWEWQRIGRVLDELNDIFTRATNEFIANQNLAHGHQGDSASQLDLARMHVDSINFPGLHVNAAEMKAYVLGLWEALNALLKIRRKKDRDEDVHEFFRLTLQLMTLFGTSPELFERHRRAFFNVHDIVGLESSRRALRGEVEHGETRFGGSLE